MAESPLDNVEVDWKMDELRAMMVAGESVLQIARRLAKKYDLPIVGPEVVMTGESYAAYESAVIGRDWDEADPMYANSLSDLYPAKCREMLEGEGWARALSRVLRDELDRIDVLWRWMELKEIPSYEGGTFESRIEKDGGRRGYKALSMYENSYSGVRRAGMRVPIDGAVRQAIKPVAYTALPRPLQPFQERIGDAKEIRHAGETECRVLDSTPVPRGSKIEISFD